MEGKPVSAREIMRIEEIRQNNIRDNIILLFSELSPQKKFRVVDELIRDEKMAEQKFLELCFDSVIEPCPICGSHDLFFKVKQEYRDRIRYRWNETYGVKEIEHQKEPSRAIGSFMCGKCKLKTKIYADRVPELYQKWNKFAIEKRRW